MADRVWIGTDGADWADPANWQGTIVPEPGDAVTIQSTLAETITISTTDTIASLSVSDPAASFDILNTGTIFISGDVAVNVLTATIEGTIVSGGNISITAADNIDAPGGLDAAWIGQPDRGH